MAEGAGGVKPLLIIPMTGISSRFTAAGYDVPKFMLEVDGQYVIDHVLDMYPGWDDVVFICNAVHLDDERLGLAEHLLSRRPQGRIVRRDERDGGPGMAVLAARDLIAEDRPVVVNYCDFTVYWDPQVLADRLSSGDVDGVIPAYTGFHPHMAFSTSYAYVRREGGLVTAIQEKQPFTSDPHSEYASTGTYAFASGRVLLDALDEQVRQGLTLGDEYYLSLTFTPMLDAGMRVEVLDVQHFMQWGTPQDFEEYRQISDVIGAWTQPRIRGDVRSASSRVILASGAGQRFADRGYDLPKPALPIAGRSMVEHAIAGIPGESTVLVTRNDLPHGEIVDVIAGGIGARIVSLPGLSQGQAESALRGLEAVADAGPVTVAACDALPVVSGPAFDAALAAAGPDGLVVWIARPYHLAARRPAQYGWVTLDGDSIGDVWLKQEPTGPDAGVVVGTFTFASRDSGISQIQELMDADIRINGEFYLDSLIELLLASGRRVVPLILDGFVAAGTPDEYETVRYWQSCFHKWALHPYALAADPLVPPTERADLDHEWRRFDPRLGARG